jgi:hypothetical protein
MGYPFNYKFPSIIRLGEANLPLKKFNKVVFPEPEGPRIAVKVPGLRTPSLLLIIILSIKGFLAHFF